MLKKERHCVVIQICGYIDDPTTVKGGHLIRAEGFKQVTNNAEVYAESRIYTDFKRKTATSDKMTRFFFQIGQIRKLTIFS